MVNYREDTNDREMLLNRAAQAAEINQGGYWKSDVLDVALVHLIESRENIDAARDRTDLPPETIQEIVNTRVLKFRFRTSVDGSGKL